MTPGHNHNLWRNGNAAPRDAYAGDGNQSAGAESHTHNGYGYGGHSLNGHNGQAPQYNNNGAVNGYAQQPAAQHHQQPVSPGYVPYEVVPAELAEAEEANYPEYEAYEAEEFIVTDDVGASQAYEPYQPAHFADTQQGSQDHGQGYPPEPYAGHDPQQQAYGYAQQEPQHQGYGASQYQQPQQPGPQYQQQQHPAPAHPQTPHVQAQYVQQPQQMPYPQAQQPQQMHAQVLPRQQAPLFQRAAQQQAQPAPQSGVQSQYQQQHPPQPPLQQQSQAQQQGYPAPHLNHHHQHPPQQHAVQHNGYAEPANPPMHGQAQPSHSSAAQQVHGRAVNQGIFGQNGAFPQGQSFAQAQQQQGNQGHGSHQAPPAPASGFEEEAEEPMHSLPADEPHSPRPYSRPQPARPPAFYQYLSQHSAHQARNGAPKPDSRAARSMQPLFPRGISKPTLASQEGNQQNDSSSMNHPSDAEYPGAPVYQSQPYSSAPVSPDDTVPGSIPPDATYMVDPAAERPGLSLLGRSESRLPASPDEAVLETFHNPSPARDYLIQFATEEFTSVCPVTGQPDFARINLEYVPDVLCVESKSLKFYLASFRNERAFNEAVTNRILDDFVRAVQPRKATVKGAFAARGGIALTVVADYVRPPVPAAPPTTVASSATPRRATGPVPLPTGPGAAAPAEVPSHRPLMKRPGQPTRSMEQHSGGRSETETRVL